ncbi:hypothetical protein TNCV_3036001 [Trichonephila clavipes]|nr:hypothetical protein TNCV_3036001 [Trichonephila clavipes]
MHLPTYEQHRTKLHASPLSRRNFRRTRCCRFVLEFNIGKRAQVLMIAMLSDTLEVVGGTGMSRPEKYGGRAASLPGVKAVTLGKRVSSFVAIDNSHLNLVFNQTPRLNYLNRLRSAIQMSIIDSQCLQWLW